MRPLYNPIISAVPLTKPFIGPEALERRTGIPIELRLGANESPFGVSPKARLAMAKALEHPEFYGDPEGWLLRAELALVHSIKVDNVSLGAGIDELMANACRLFVQPGDKIVTTLGSYPTFEFGAVACGGVIHRVPYVGQRPDLEALAQTTVDLKAKVLYLANPDNPSGAFHSRESIFNLVSQLPRDCVLFLDEAYCDFAGALLPVQSQLSNVLRFRTFSKAHGMAGLRIGYVIGDSEVIRSFDKVRMHFGVNSIAQAGALASLKDTEFVVSVVQETAKGRNEMVDYFGGQGFHPLPSSTNFLTVDVGDRLLAEQLVETLLQAGVFIRKPSQPPLGGCIRVTIGHTEQRQLFYERFESSLKAIKGSR